LAANETVNYTSDALNRRMRRTGVGGRGFALVRRRGTGCWMSYTYDPKGKRRGRRTRTTGARRVTFTGSGGNGCWRCRVRTPRTGRGSAIREDERVFLGGSW